MRGRGLFIIALAVGAPGAAAAQAASAPAPANAQPPATVSEVVVTADKAGLLERKPSDTVFGLDKPLIDTPRSATFVSDETIRRYGITTVDDLVEVVPGAFTASFYGVPGSLNIRGTYAENYFQGFKLIENLGTYTTPIGDAARVEVVRGPPSPVYGPGKVGGFLNFIPKTAKDSGAYLSAPTGELDLTLGDYQKKTLTGQFGAPVDVAGLHGGVYAYGEVDDSHSYYSGIYPRHQLIELSSNLDLPGRWSLEADVLVYHSEGDVQTAGWNRLTQNLIDNRTYITGRNTALQNTPGVPYLTPAQTVVGGAGFYPFAVGFDTAYYGGPPTSDPRYALDTGVGTTKLSPRTVYISGQDFSRTLTPTVYLGATKTFGDDSKLSFQGFYNGLENQRYVSYGFPAWLRASVIEGRISYTRKDSALGGLVSANTIVGVSSRFSYSRDMQSFDSGLIALDRRDISHGATPTDSICDPFSIHDDGDSIPANCLGWETDIHSQTYDNGAFFTSDVKIGRLLDVVLGARYDEYKVRSNDTGILHAYDVPTTAAYSASKGDGTYSASVSYKLPLHLLPYFTYAKSSALEYGQASDISPNLIPSGGWLRNSQLTEGGLKVQELGGTLLASLAYYRQNRPELESNGAGGQVVVDTVGKGVELEARWLATHNLSFTFAGNIQHTEVVGSDPSFTYLPAYAVCGQSPSCGEQAFGGQYVTYSLAGDPVLGRTGAYAFTPIPHSVVSLYANYITERHRWGRAGVTWGFSHVTQTAGILQDPVVYAAYFVSNASAFYQQGMWEIDGNIDNVFDKLYFTPDADTYVNTAALPSIGRVWRVTLRRSF